MMRAVAVAVLSALVAGCADAPPAAAPEPLTVYSGRNESLIAPLLARFTEATGIEVEVRYGETAEMAATLLEEGDGSPADAFLSQDAAALGALAAAGRLQQLPAALLERVPASFRDPAGRWVGVSGRARAVVFNPERIDRSELPSRLEALAEPRFAGRFGVPPTNGSFQAHMAVYRAVEGAEALDALLAGMVANDVQRYPKNSAIVQATAAGEVDFGLVNHYYVSRALAEDPTAPVAVAYMVDGAASNFVNLAGVGVLSDGRHARQLVDYLLGEAAQRYFAEETFEYPLIAGVEAAGALTPLSDIPTPEVDFAAVAEGLAATLEQITASGLVE